MTLIALDLDGTLEDSRADMVAAVERVRAALGLPVRSASELRPFVNAGMDTLYRACFDDFLANGHARYEQVRAAYEADYLAHVADQTRLYEGIAEALASLAAHGRLACVTNKPERISRALLAALGVGARFAAVIGGDTCPHAKPNPIMLAAAVRAAGFEVEPDRAFMIGDTTADVHMGKAYGATTIWCAWGYADAPGEAPDFEARTPADLVELVTGGD